MNKKINKVSKSIVYLIIFLILVSAAFYLYKMFTTVPVTGITLDIVKVEF